MTTEVDVIVIGLGPGGETLATTLAEAGLEVVAIDKHLVGGECPYYGCIPSKMMVRAADVLAEARRVPQLAGSSTVGPDWTSVAERIRAEATDDWDDSVAVKRIEDAGVTFVRGRARLDGPRTVVVGDERMTARRGVVLNTGTDPAVPPIEGLADTPYWTNRDAVKLEHLPASLIVIGGGAIGAELTQAFSRFGVTVTLLEVADRIIANDEPEASKVLTQAFGMEGIQVLAGVDISRVAYEEGQFSVNLSGENSNDAEDVTIRADALLVAAGRRTNLTDLGLETVGIDPPPKALDTDAHMQVTEGLWAIGDITAKGAFTHVSIYQAKIATQAVLAAAGDVGAAANDAQAKSATAFSGPQEADYRAVPRVTFTDPEVGSVGMTEQQAIKAGIRVQVGRSDLSTTSRGWLHKAGNDGLVKVVADAENGILVGATTMGPSGGEMLAALTLAVHARIPISTLRSMIYAFPTFHEAIKAALDDLDD